MKETQSKVTGPIQQFISFDVTMQKLPSTQYLAEEFGRITMKTMRKILGKTTRSKSKTVSKLLKKQIEKMDISSGSSLDDSNESALSLSESASSSDENKPSALPSHLKVE